MAELFELTARAADQKNLSRAEIDHEDVHSRFLADAFQKPLLAKVASSDVQESKIAAPSQHDLSDQSNWRWHPPQGILIERSLNLNLTKEEKERIGKKIWQNESSGTFDGLTAWNKGEEFPSLGIGHFIWMPKGVDLPFGDSFPEMIKSLRDAGSTPPAWLKETEPCPWNTRKEFLKEFNGKKLTELRQYLSDTVGLQTDFIVNRLETSLPKILDTISDPAEKQKIQDRFYKVLNSGPAGVFCLVDYVNFKGEGLELVPEYNNISWGLKQVLQGMSDKPNAVQDFSDSAKEVLRTRVKNAPKHRHEEQWLNGWLNRVDRYVTDPPLR